MFRFDRIEQYIFGEGGGYYWLKPLVRIMLQKHVFS